MQPVFKVNFDNKSIRIEAQAYLEKFYQDFGFKTLKPIIVDDIPHFEMLKE